LLVGIQDPSKKQKYSKTFNIQTEDGDQQKDESKKSTMHLVMQLLCKTPTAAAQ